MSNVSTVTLIIILAIISYSGMEWADITIKVYAQIDTNNNNSPLYQLGNNGTLAKILSSNLVNYLNESATIVIRA
jgi:hypothetical protein